jgi:hypothetical protein
MAREHGGVLRVVVQAGVLFLPTQGHIGRSGEELPVSVVCGGGGGGGGGSQGEAGGGGEGGGGVV